MTHPSVATQENPNGSGGVRAVLVLKTPPAPYRLDSWYWNPVTGVPFLLLNLLALQRGGVDHITVFHPEVGAIPENRIQSLSQDRRLLATVDWEQDGTKLREAVLHPDCRLVVNGAALHGFADIRAVLAGTPSPGTRVMTGPDEFWAESLGNGSSRGDWARDGLAWLPGKPDSQVYERRDFRRLSNQRLNACGLSNDSLLDRWITRHISRQITRVFLHTPLTPNQITLIALLVGFAGAGSLMMGGYAAGVAGALLVQISAWIDCSDGEVARLRFQESPLGGILDIWADNLVHAAAFFSMGLGLYFSTEQGIYKILGSLAVVGTFASFALLQSSVVEEKNRAARGETGVAENQAVSQLANRDFTYFMLFLALIDQLPLFLFLTAIGSNVFAAWLLFLRFRSGWATSTGLCSKNPE